MNRPIAPLLKKPSGTQPRSAAEERLTVLWKVAAVFEMVVANKLPCAGVASRLKPLDCQTFLLVTKSATPVNRLPSSSTLVTAREMAPPATRTSLLMSRLPLLIDKSAKGARKALLVITAFRECSKRREPPLARKVP